MANTRYDVLATREYKDRDGNKKTAWTNVGVAFEQKDGKGFNLSLHCMPAPDMERGEYKLVMRIPQPRDERGSGGGGKPSAANYPTDDSDGVPF
jgi:hypothetical protein